VIECPEDCPYCSGEMCARFDGLGCQHDATERHGYPLCYDPSAHEKTAPAAPPDACPHGHFGGYNCPECGDATTAPAAVTYDYQPDDCDHDEWRETCVVCGLTRTPAPAPTLDHLAEAARAVQKAWRLVNDAEYFGDEDDSFLLANGETLDDPIGRLIEALAALEADHA